MCPKSHAIANKNNHGNQKITRSRISLIHLPHKYYKVVLFFYCWRFIILKISSISSHLGVKEESSLSFSLLCWLKIILGKICISCRILLPIAIERHTLLKSPHINKKHRAQYEVRTHGRMLQVCITSLSANGIVSILSLSCHIFLLCPSVFSGYFSL